MGAWMHKHALTSTSTSLFVSMCAAPLVGMVQSGTEQEVLDTAAAAEFEHCSKRAKKLHQEKNAAGQSLHAVKLHDEKNADGHSVLAVKMNTALHEEKNAAGQSLHTLKLHKEKNADGHSVHAVKMCAKRKYSGHADESKANWACPNCPRRYFYDSPLEN
jgi:hypothetical protein